MSKEVQVRIHGSVGSIEASYSLPKQHEGKPVVIVCHPHSMYGGTMDNKVVYTLFKTFKKLSLPVLRFNFRGVGKTQGAYNGGVGETDDLLSIIKWVETHMPNNPIWLAGFSFGAYVALRAQEQANIQRLILIAPPVSLFQCESYQLQDIPCTVIHGSDDDLIPYKAVHSWVGKSQTNVVLHCLEGACHFFHGFLSELSSIVRNSIREENCSNAQYS